MLKISATVITLNEERLIEKCLQSLQGIADEIVIVDSFSTDRTQEICNRYAARFVQHPFEGYIEQKNYAMAIATHDMILSLDADEALSDELRKNILKVKENGCADGYSFRRITFIGELPVTHGSWYPDFKLRLWDRRKGRWGGTNPHDRVEMNPRTKVKKIKGTILHYSFRTLDDFYRQSEKFVKVAVHAMYQKRTKVGPVMQVAKMVWAFYKSYFVKCGFLDGRTGFIIAKVIAQSTYRKYSALRKLYCEK